MQQIRLGYPHLSIAATAVGTVCVAPVADASQVRYEFRIVAVGSPSGEYMSVSLSRPSIGNDGRVLFSAQYQDGSGAVLLDANGVTSRLSTEGCQPSWQNQISRDGRVVAWIEETSFGNFLKRWADESIDLSLPAAEGSGAGMRVACNDGGAVAYTVGTNSIRRVSAFGDESVIGGDGSDISQVTSIPSMNQAGDVVWSGSSQSSGFAVWQNDTVIVGGSTFEHTNQVAVNGDGVVAFVARPNPYSVELPTLYTSHDGALATRHALLQQWIGGQESHLGINSVGDILYDSQPTETEPYGLWVYRADGSRHLIVAEGDQVVAGDTAVNVWRMSNGRSIGPRSMNDHGQVAFLCWGPGWVSEYILIATPVNACAADYNGSGDAGDVLDLLDFFNDFGTCLNQPFPCGVLGEADVNGDTIVDILDFLDFLDAFGQGC